MVDRYPLPKIADMMMLLQGAKVFSTINLKSTNQIKLGEDSKDLTAFVIPFSTFRFARLPLDLVSAPSVFQQALENIL